MKPTTRRRIQRFAGLAAFLAALWLLWWTPVVLPLKLFVVLLHEISHAIAAVATGGTVERIVLHMNEGGATYTRGGSAFVILTAGYLGSLLWGLLLIELAGARPRIARAALLVLAASFLMLAAVFVRNIFGFLFTLVFGVLLVIATRRLAPCGVALVLLALGITSALYAFLDIRSDILRQPGRESDAYMLAQLTGVPTPVWGVVWIGAGAVACWFASRRWRRRF